ncbi:MAG TPA: LLM class flavin-dependent oxidoreductase [Acidimicrobiales bacterium]|jgi:alkanesulfonate monooxygenase SsuD/methylene tetrahydromethanopterin reductase-like flavin-dependent oxidoreductase (luciferase family)|nr:LLM class flavin-dependent oxidoreductase [Acidimicrobiales bacterium]
MIIDTEFNSAAQVPIDICVRAAEEAERRGFGAVWKGESNSRDPLVMLSAMAARTERLALGTAIYHVFGRSPVTMGIQAATLNELSRGRLILGLGVGNEVIAGWHGERFERPLRLAREYVDIVRAVYSGQKLPDYVGERFATRGGFRLAFEPPEYELPIWLAALGPQMARLAGKLCGGIIINMANGDMIAEIVKSFHEGAREAGRDPSQLAVVSKIRVCLSDDVGAARWALKKVLTFYCLQRGYSDLLRRMGWSEVVDRVKQLHLTEGFTAARRSIPDEMVDDVPMYAGRDLGGLPAKLAGHERAGVTRCIVACVPEAEDRQWEELSSFLRQAEPLVRSGHFA